MQLETVNFGVVELDEKEIIYFPEGLPGFEENRKFALLGYDASLSSPFFFMQSVENPGLCFVVTDPFAIYANYEVNVDEEDVRLLEITDPNTVMTLAIVVIPENIREMRVNLKAPVIINIEKRLGKQIIQNDDSLPVRYYLCRD